MATYMWWEILVGWIVMGFAGAVQGTTGFGFAVLSVPILSLINPELAPVPQILMSLPVAGYMAWRERAQLDVSRFGWLIVGRLPGSAIGALLLITVSWRALDSIISSVVLLAVTVSATGFSIPRTPRTSLVAGIASGVTATTSGIGGPPLALLLHGAPGAELRSNVAAVFGFGVVITVAALLLAGAVEPGNVITAGFLLPAAVLGLWTSKWLSKRVEGKLLRFAVLSMAALAAIALGVRTLVA